jgi:ribosomal protein S18 acetylase RimI-like enzyme
MTASIQSPDPAPPVRKVAPDALPVERLPDSARAAASTALARAFYHDPMFVYLLPEAKTRGGNLRWFMARGLKTGTLFGRTETVFQDGQPGGAAVWIRPGQTDLRPLQMLRAGFGALPIRFGLGGVRRFIGLAESSEAAHHLAVPEPHWYLLILGVDPARQRSGAGGALVRHGTARADADGVPSYLETMNEANLPFYRRAGFRVVQEVEVPGGGLHVWALRRDAGG